MAWSGAAVDHRNLQNLREVQAPSSLKPDVNHWIGWFWRCPQCGTFRIGRSPLMRWLAESIHREFCTGKSVIGRKHEH